MREWKVGIIGYGWAAGAHIAALNQIPGVSVVAVHSSRSLDPEVLSRQHGGPIRYYGRLETMLAEPDIDAVSICSRPSLHVAQAIAAAEHGKHIIVEKPVGLSLSDCRALRDAVSKAGVRTCVCFECRFSSQFLATKAVIDQGLLGALHYGEVDYYHGINPRYRQFGWVTTKPEGGSSLLCAGCHAMDALLLCLGDDVDEVFSYSTHSAGSDYAPYEYPTTAVTVLKFRSGRVGKVTSCIDCSQPYYFHVHLVGSEGALLDDKFHSNKLAGLKGDAWSRLSMKLMDSGDVADHPYKTQFQAFFEAIGQDREMPLTSLSQALYTHEVIFAADRSAELGRPVKMSELG